MASRATARLRRRPASSRNRTGRKRDGTTEARHMKPNRRAAMPLGLAGMLLLSLCVSSVEAQDWPTRPIKLMSTQAAGGAGDVVAHAVGEAFTAATKLPVVVENPSRNRAC